MKGPSLQALGQHSGDQPCGSLFSHMEVSSNFGTGLRMTVLIMEHQGPTPLKFSCKAAKHL